MELITQRKLIREVASRWRKAYKDTGFAIGERCQPKLDALDGSTATPEDVANIIGNTGWTSIKCDECQKSVTEAVRLGEEPDYESNTAHLCLECLLKATRLIAEAIYT